MKRTLFQLFNLLMACTILLSSTGFGLVERSCQMRGKTIYLNLKEAQANQCASDQKAISIGTEKVNLSRTPCCQDETKYENVDVTSSLTQLVAKFLKSVTHSVAAGFATLLTWLVNVLFSSDSSASLPIHSPPLPAGRALLALLQRLLI